MAVNITALLRLFLVIVAGFSLSLSAQIDSSFVETFATPFRVNGGLRFRDNSATFSVEDREALRLDNRGLAFRLGGRYKWIGYTFSIPLSDLGTGSEFDDQGSSLGVNLQLYRNKFYLNANVRRTRGFLNERVGEPDVFREDIRFLNVLLFGFRILNSNRFSLRSSFKQRNRQLRSSGSLLLGGVVNRQVLDANSLRVPLSSQGEVELERYAQFKAGVGLGYVYTFVSGRFFVTPLIVAGPEVRFVSYDPIDEDRQIERVRISPRIRGRLALGINGLRLYTSLNAAYLPSIDASDNLDTRVDQTTIELVIGYRIGVGN